MIHAEPTPSVQSVNRVRAWLKAGDRPRAQIAAEAGVDEKTLRLAVEDSWNPTVNTLQKLEAIMPGDWQPPKKRRAA